MLQTAITVRTTTAADLPALVTLERAVWEQQPGTHVMTESELRGWLDQKSPYFLVAETDGEVIGYFFGLQVTFVPTEIGIFLDFARKHEFWMVPHDTTGQTVFGVSMAAKPNTKPGWRLMAALREKMNKGTIADYIAISRMDGFGAYCAQNPDTRQFDPRALATWYAHKCAQRAGNRQWTMRDTPIELDLPHPKPDPVLSAHLRATYAGLLEVVPDFMPDKKSRGFGALIRSERPHKKPC